MGFKDILENDLDTFLNQEEFGDPHTIDDVEMTVLVDDNELIEREKKYKEEVSTGVSKALMLIYVKESEFGPLPKIGRVLKFDNKIYQVIDAKREGGLHSITIMAHRSGSGVRF